MMATTAKLPDMVSQRLDDAHDFDEWRRAARRLLADGVEPERIIWRVGDADNADLFARAADAVADRSGSAKAYVPRAFLVQAQSVILHSDAQRHALLYRLLWRLQQQPGLMGNAADSDIRRLTLLRQQVSRDIHKMRAFVRFRQVSDTGIEDFGGQDGSEQDGGEQDRAVTGIRTPHYVAWFEPQFAILRANAAFFVNRFAQMRWSILTPRGTLHWDGATLTEGPPARKEHAPEGDVAEELWLDYYAATFNPARLKIDAMVKEMPRRYWQNLPEARLIPALVASAQQREAAMVAIGQSAFPASRPATLEALASGIGQCRACSIGCNGTRAVPGEGNPHARLAIIGEQPGDQEERSGRPFVGPAGQLLDRHLQRAGIERASTWMTNAVKHFKHEPTQKRRLHQTPNAAEIDHCRWWLESELALVRPPLILALGASAARGLLGRTVSVQKERGRMLSLANGSAMMVTTHPSYLLRIDGTAREAQEALFHRDLVQMATLINSADG